jgi:hypothetical protein
MIRIALVMIGLGGLSLAATVQAADHRLSQEPDRSRSLGVTVERAAPDREDQLVLRGAAFGVGVTPQVEGLSCDGSPLAPAGAGVGPQSPGGSGSGKRPPESAGDVSSAGGAVAWVVARGCRQISWSIPLDLPGTTDASAQRSLRSADGSFTFVSEASSLPRLADPALRATGNSGGLPARLQEVWTAKYDKEGRPTSDFASRLALPPAAWEKLSARFLGPG